MVDKRKFSHIQLREDSENLRQLAILAKRDGLTQQAVLRQLVRSYILGRIRLGMIVAAPQPQQESKKDYTAV